MTNREIAAILFNITRLLADQHANPYRIRAYRRAARRLLQLPHSVADRVRNEQPLGIPFLGKRLTATISSLAINGTCDVYETLLDELPSAERALLHVPGIGPALAQRITREFKTEDADALLETAAARGLQQIWGIGPTRARRIMQTLQTTNNAPPSETPYHRDGNVLYVQESFWHASREQQQAA